MHIASTIEHSFLKPVTTIADIENICSEAIEYGFRSVCVPPLFVKKTKELLKEKPVKIATVTGFPFGYSAIEAKLAETVLAIVDGADEIDMVINIAALKNADWQYLAKEINTILPLVKSRGRILKLIPETGLLTHDELITCCDIYGAAGVDIIKTSTGFASKGATVETVLLLRKHLADTIMINASGSILSYSAAKQMLEAGAKHLSPDNSLQLIQEASVLI